MIQKFLLITLSFLFSIALTGQKLSVQVNYATGNGNKNSNTIFYQEGQLLSWDDFKGKPVAASEAAALTNAGFSLELAFHQSGNNAQLVIDVTCNFSRKDSWVKQGYNTAYILNHEQKHFDIAYIHTLLFIQKLKDASLTNDNYAAVIQKIHHETAATMSKMQNEYDKETSHSRITAKQEEWNKNISKQLALLVKE
jgi:hypothetical protein